MFFNRFQRDHLVLGASKKSANILQNYPKYLQKFSLMKLQFKDQVFRETFIYQVMIFLDCLKNPIKDQINVFKIDEQDVKYLDVLFARAQGLLRSSEKQPFGKSQMVGQKRSQNNGKSESIFDQSMALSKILKREDNWAKAKNMINNKKTDEPERQSHFDLTNFDLEVSQTVANKFQNKRNQKAQDRRR